MSNASVLNTPPSHRILHAQAYVGLKVDHRAADLGDVFQLQASLLDPTISPLVLLRQDTLHTTVHIYITMSADKLSRELLHKLILKSFEGQLSDIFHMGKLTIRPG